MKGRWPYVTAVVLALVALNMPAYADDTTADVRCVASALALTSTADATTKASLVMSAIYYIGKLDGRAPSLDLEDAIVKELATMTAAQIGSEAVRCGNALSLRGQQITTIGQHMIERGKSAPAEPPESTN